MSKIDELSEKQIKVLMTIGVALESVMVSQASYSTHEIYKL